jgi:predicted TIM-barrel fold metal-dependent hydrolase
MWVRKYERDRRLGVDSPMPTQVLSNEEIYPRPQNPRQREWEFRIREIAERNSRRLGLSRRDFLRTSMGLAAVFLASNQVYGQNWDVEEAETLELAAYEARWPKSEYFIFDVQAHFTDGIPLDFRESEFMRNLGIELKNDADAYSFRSFFKEMFLDSETDMLMISGVPGREIHRGEQGKVLEGAARSAGSLLPSWLMARRRDDINSIAGGQRALSQSNCAPNHYWNRTSDTMDKAALAEQMEREVKLYGSSSWKLYCHFDPARSGHGFQLDDDNMAYFYELSRKLGLKMVSVHKGFAAQSRRFGHLANPQDVEKAALNNPDFTFVVYHSAIKHGPTEPEFEDPQFFDPTTGDFAWHDVLMDIKRRNPRMNNVYAEIGSAFGMLAIAHPVMAQHLMGKNIQHFGVDHVLWGTDCIWWGSPQWAIDAFKRFQISDELCEKFGYRKLSKEDKAKIFGLNAARLYGVDPSKARKGIQEDSLSKIKLAYQQQKLRPDNAAHGWVRAEG